MAEQDLSTSQLDPLPLPIQASDVIHVARGGQDYRVERSELVKMFLSTLSDAAISSAINGQSLVFHGTTSKWENDFVSWATISGKPGTFQPTAHTHLWDEITDAPTSFTPAAHTHLWAEIADKPTTFPAEVHDHNTAYYTKTQLSTSGAGAQVHWDNITNVPELGTGSGDMSKSVYDQDNDGIVDAAAVVPWLGITGKPDTFTPETHTHLWADLTDKPATFPPESHTHLWAQITDKPATFPAEPHNHDSFYWRKDELSLPGGGGTVHWENVTYKPNVFPPDLHNHNDLYPLLDHTHHGIVENQIGTAPPYTWADIEDSDVFAVMDQETGALKQMSMLDIKLKLDDYNQYRWADFSHTHGQYLQDVPNDGKTYSRTYNQWVENGTTSIVTNEVPTGAVDGSNTIFTFAHSYVPGSTQVYRDGQLLNPGGNDYTEMDPVEGTIMLVTAPAAETTIIGSYQHAVTATGNADTLDGLHAAAFSPAEHDHVHTHGTTDVLVCFGNLVTIPAGTTYHMAPGKIGADSLTHNMPMPVSGVIESVAVRLSPGQPGSGSLVFTVYVQQAVTALSLTIPAGSPASGYSFDADVPFSTNQFLRVAVTNNATEASAGISFVTLRVRYTSGAVQ